MRILGALVVAIIALGCSTGEGEGEVKSENLYIENCWNGHFDLAPTFFGAVPYRNTLTIRIQRGDNIEEVSDGLIVLVDDVSGIRKALGDYEVGMPVGVAPPGVPITYQSNPAKVHLSLYLHDSCHEQIGALYSMGGSITFNSLFSGDPNEDSAEDRLTDASFDAQFADPRQMGSDGTVPVEKTSNVTGWFRFYFQRGQPAQPFP